MTQISILIGLETIFSLHMLPKATSSPRGRANTSVRKKIRQVVPKPCNRVKVTSHICLSSQLIFNAVFFRECSYEAFFCQFFDLCIDVVAKLSVYFTETYGEFFHRKAEIHGDEFSEIVRAFACQRNGQKIIDDGNVAFVCRYFHFEY